MSKDANVVNWLSTNHRLFLERIDALAKSIGDLDGDFKDSDLEDCDLRNHYLKDRGHFSNGGSKGYGNSTNRGFKDCDYGPDDSGNFANHGSEGHGGGYESGSSSSWSRKSQLFARASERWRARPGMFDIFSESDEDDKAAATQTNLGNAHDQLGSAAQEEIEAPLPVFCFPYGHEQDVSHGAASLVQAAGLHGALTAIPGYVSSDGQTRSDPFLLPRFAMPNNLADISQIAFGFQRFKEVSRSVFGLSF